MPEPRSLCNQICSCCKSVGAIRTCIVIFGITTVALAAYAHLESPYTKKASTPYYDEYFTTWERMHNYTSPHKNANELLNSSTTENNTETSTLSSEDHSTEETDNVRNGGVSSTTDDIQTQSTPESNPDITPDTVRRKRQDSLITSTEVYTTTLSQITTETSVEMTNVMDDAESTTESIFNTTANYANNFNDSTTENHTKMIHAVTLGAQKVLDLTPRIVESGYETCLSFKLFMHELEERLIELDISTQLTTIKSEDVPDNVDVLLKDCPDLFYERCFLGAAIISLLLTTLCLSLAVIFCPKLIGRLVSRLIDASYHLLCGIALLAGAGLTVKFLYDMDQICTTSADLHEQFYEAIAEYQLHWHFRTNKSFNLLDDRGNVEKLNKINDNLVPRYYGFLTEQKKNEGQTDPTTAANSTNPTSQQHVKRKRKRKFSWTRRYSKRYRKTVIENEGWFSQGAYACEFYMKYYWKAAAVISGTITAILYIAAAIGILFKKEQPKTTTPPDSEESTTEESEDEDLEDAENTNIDDKPQEATNKIKEDNTDDNKNDNNNNNNTEKPAKIAALEEKNESKYLFG